MLSFLLLPLSSFFYLVMNEALLAARQCTRLTLHDSKHAFVTSVETNHGVLPWDAFVPFIFHLKCHLAFRTMASTKYSRVFFSHPFWLATYGLLLRIAYFYLDCFCLVIPNAFLNDRYEEHWEAGYFCNS